MDWYVITVCRSIYNNETNEFLGIICTSSPQEFKLWLAMNCPSHKLISDFSTAENELWVLQFLISNTAERVLFKLMWQTNE